MNQGTAVIHAERVTPRRRVPVRVDLRTRTGRRAAQLTRYFTEIIEERGQERTIALASAICSAAELVAITEDARAKVMRGAHLPLAHLAALQRLADAAVARLGVGVDEPAPEVEPELTVEEYLARAHGEGDA
jgi:hypothetical protein